MRSPSSPDTESNRPQVDTCATCRHYEGHHHLDGSCGYAIGARVCACTGWVPHPSIEELIERSSLGTPAARAARESVDPALAQRVVEASRLYDSAIWEEVRDERARAHIKHGGTSMESLPVDDLTRLTVLMEEVGEVAREFNEARHRLARSNPGLDRYAIRKELIQVAAMAAAWADAIKVPTYDFPPDDDPWADDTPSSVDNDGARQGDQNNHYPPSGDQT